MNHNIAFTLHCVADHNDTPVWLTVTLKATGIYEAKKKAIMIREDKNYHNIRDISAGTACDDAPEGIWTTETSGED
ncbi:hypothetical protein CRQ31_09810 [Salmonella enterica subsp. enterica serovar Worthington]|nr:hypothetical protein [Salmonella enterica subsp. enterica serovar Worthington]